MSHVVYVSPFELPEDVVDYYRRLLSLGEAGSGDPAETPRQSTSWTGAACPFGETSDDVLPGGAFTVVVPELSDDSRPQRPWPKLRYVRRPA